MPHTHTNTSAPPVLGVTWSQSYLTPGQENIGTLSLALQSENASVTLSSGDSIVFSGWPTDWVLSTSDSNWSASANVLTWTGSGTFTVDQTPQTVSVAIEPSATFSNADEIIQVQLQHDSATPLSSEAQLIFNLLLPAEPVTAFASDSALVILFSPMAVPFSNTLNCTLLNPSTSPGVLTNASIKVSFHAQNATGQSVDITQSVSSDTLSISVTNGSALTFTKASDGSWSAPVSQLWAIGESSALMLSISGLSLDNSEVSTVEVRYQLSGFSSQAYTTSAWFTALGPYTISVELDTSNPSAGNYGIQSSGAGTFTASYINQQAEGPPLIPQVLDVNQQVILPPIPGGFSWSTTEMNFPTEYPFQSSNTLYWLDTSDLGNLRVVAECVINLNQLSPNSPAPLNFSGMNLTGQDFTGWKNLLGANFSNTVLSNVIFPTPSYQVTTIANNGGINAVFSPDDNYVFLSTPPAESLMGLLTILDSSNADSSQWTTLTPPSSMAQTYITSNLAVINSSDYGKFLIMGTQQQTGGYQLSVVTMTSGNQPQQWSVANFLPNLGPYYSGWSIQSSSLPTNIAVSPDGSSIFVTYLDANWLAACQVFILSVNGTDPTQWLASCITSDSDTNQISVNGVTIQQVNTVTFSPNGAYAYLQGVDSNNATQVWIYSMTSLSFVSTIPGISNVGSNFSGVAVSNDGSVGLMSGGSSSPLLAFDFSSSNPAQWKQTGSLNISVPTFQQRQNLMFSADGNWVFIWNFTSVSLIAALNHAPPECWPIFQISNSNLASCFQSGIAVAHSRPVVLIPWQTYDYNGNATSSLTVISVALW